MRTSIYLIVLFAIVTQSNLRGQTNSVHLEQSDTSLIDLNNIDCTIFESDSLKSAIFTNDYKTIKITKPDIIKCEILLKKFIYQYNIKGKRQMDSLKCYFKEVKNVPDVQLYETQFHIDLTKYGRQYLLVQSPDKHKIAYINCFCNPGDFPYRKKDWVSVDDGGNCFFNVKIDLTDNKIIEYSENGVA
jgi:hypothetical protein